MGVQVATLLAAAPTTTTPNPSQALRDSLHPLSQMLLGLWPLWTLLGIIALGRLLIDARRMRRLHRAGMAEIDRMTGPQFERRLAALFRSLGYRAEVVGSARGDFGGDLVVSKDGTRTVVQAKCWRKKNVGVKAVQEAVAAKAVYNANDAMVVTNSRFTKQAQHLAQKNRVKLWGRDELVVALLKGQEVNDAPAVLDPAMDVPLSAGSAAVVGDATAAIAERPPSPVSSPSGAFCARCGEPVSVKVRDYCHANWERFGGLVYCFKDQRVFRRRRA
jgi:restriction system protein